MTRLPIRLLICFAGVFFGENVFAQDKDSTGNSFGEVMRSNDKIYVVMAICLTILAGLIFYAIRIDKKINRMERSSR